MKLHQLRYLAAVAQNGLNITAAAHKLHTSQPGVSKQIKLLEDELGFQIFVREGRNLTRITPAGQQVIDRALRILQEAQSIRHLSTELRDEGKGSLSIGTTHTQARYVLPDVIREFRARYPQVRLNLHQGTSEQIAEMVASDRIDCAIATGSEALFSDLTLLPCYRWYRTVIVPKGHPLANGGRLSFKALAAYPLITYTFSFTGPSSLHEAFARAALTPNIAITARDADVIQTYVRLGLGSASWRTWRSMSATLTSRRSTPRICLRRTPAGSVFAAARCYASTCMSLRSCWRRTWTGAWWTGRIALPRPRR